ncbi:MAG: PAS domain S-box protein, partial [Dehalococcoidia bacterium]
MRVRDGPFAAANESTQAQRPVRALTLISQYIGVFIALMALVILCGWIFNIPFLKTPFPGVIPMKANAAVCFIFSGTALWLLRSSSTVSPAQKIQRYLGYFLALLTAVIGLLTLLEYIFNWNMGLDQLIVKETTVSPGTVYPGRMALYAAVNFLVTGLALLLLEVKSRRHHHPSSYLMIIVGLTGLVAIIGYIYGAGEFVGVPPYTPLALDAAIGFLLLFIGLLLARPTAATFALVAGNYPGSRVISFLIPAFIVLVILTGWLRLRGQLMGYYSTELGIAFFSLINIAVATTMIFLVAMRLYTAERRRRRAELEIRELNENLEQQITERTGDLRKSEEKYRLIFENTTEGIFQSTPEGRYISINPAFARIGGFSSPEEMINSVTDIQRQRYVHPEDRTRLMELLTNQGSVNGYEFEIKRHDGTNSWVSINIRAVRDPAGKINYLEGTLVDITERKQAEQSLREGEARYRELFDNMSSSVAVYEAIDTGEDFIIRDFNLAAEKLEKVEKKDIIGRSVRDVFPGVADLGLLDVFKRVWRTGISEHHPISQYKDSRITGWRENYVYKLPSGEIVAIYDDVTQRKLNEAALIKSEEKYRMLAAYSNQLNDISISLTESPDTKELFSRIADSFRLLTGAVAASFAVFSQEARDLKIVSLSIDPANRDKVNSIFGPELFEMRIPLSADDIGQMLSQAIRRPGDLCELSNGVIPADISDAIMAAIGCRQIVALAITFAEEVIGTCVAYLPENVAVVPDDALKTFIGMAGLAVKRRQSEERLRRFYESGLIGVIFWNMNGQITDANDKFLEMVSYTRDDLVNGRVDWTNMTPPEYRQLDDDSIAELKARGANKNPAEKEYIRKDGTRIPVVMAGATLDDDRSKGLAFVLDITDRKQAEQALRESEEKYRSLFNNAELGMYRSKIDGSGVIEVNDKLCQIIGYSKEEILSDPATVRWASIAVFNEMRQILRERGVMKDYEFDLINKSGEIRTCLGSAKLYPQEGYFEGSVEDITERKKTEEAIHSSAIFLNNMIEQSPTPTWISDDKGTLIKVNKSLCELLKVTEEELVGKYNVFKDNIVKEQGYIPLIRNVFEKGEVARFELYYDSPRLKSLSLDRTTSLILDVTISPIRDTSGRITNAAIQQLDLTERKKAEEALHSSAI